VKNELSTFSIDDPMNAEPSIPDSDGGRKSDLRDGELEKASESIVLSLEPRSNVNDDSDARFESACDERVISDAGRESDSNRHPENAWLQMQVRSESGSNNTEINAEQP
jgi:hypothetical protein